MTGARRSLPSLLILLWLRLINICAISGLFVMVLRVRPKLVAGWALYLTMWEVVLELALRLCSVAVVGGLLATIFTAAAAPFLALARDRERLAARIVQAGTAGAVFVAFGAMFCFVLLSGVSTPPLVIPIVYSAAFALALAFRPVRAWLVTSLDDLLDERVAGILPKAAAILVVVMVAGEWALGNLGQTRAIAASAPPPSGPSILLITFDALSAEDVSAYGYRLPTTPNLEKFARTSTVFTNYFSTSTFTTPSIVSILTGEYPLEHRVYYLPGRMRQQDLARALPGLLRNGGYWTGASITNPHAYFPNFQLAAEYDALPAPIYREGKFMAAWQALGLLHQAQPFGSRDAEFNDLEYGWDYLGHSLVRWGPHAAQSQYPPFRSFAQAEELLDSAPAKYFLWVHLYAPHDPYLPGPGYMGRFLPSKVMRTKEAIEFAPFNVVYKPEDQARIDQARLRYDEFIAESDAALGQFLDRAEARGLLRNTAVIISADHGESFADGVYQHAHRYQTRPEIHVPLLVHLPGQEQARRVAVAFDHTAMLPTILEIAGLARPSWARGVSLVPWLKGDPAASGEGLAFTQYFVGNSIFGPPQTGTVGVIDGRYQYVLDVATGKGKLRPLAEAQLRNADHSAENPALADELRRAIYSRFPSLPQRSQ